MQLVSVLALLAVVATASAQGPPVVSSNPTLIQTRISNPRFAPFLEAVANYNGAPIVTSSDFNFNSANKTWSVPNGSANGGGGTGPITQIRLFGNKCLDVTDGNDSDGVKLQLWTCVDENPNQKWTIDGDGTIHWAGHNKCVDLTDGRFGDPTNRIQIWTCVGNINQFWSFNPPH